MFCLCPFLFCVRHQKAVIHHGERQAVNALCIFMQDWACPCDREKGHSERGMRPFSIRKNWSEFDKQLQWMLWSASSPEKAQGGRLVCSVPRRHAPSAGSFGQELIHIKENIRRPCVMWLEQAGCSGTPVGSSFTTKHSDETRERMWCFNTRTLQSIWGPYNFVLRSK